MNLILSLIIPYFKSSYSVFHSSLSFFPSFLLFSPSPSLSFYFPVFSLSVHLSLTLYHFFLLEESFAKLRSLRKYLIWLLSTQIFFCNVKWCVALIIMQIWGHLTWSVWVNGGAVRVFFLSGSHWLWIFTDCWKEETNKERCLDEKGMKEANNKNVSQ